MEPDIFAPFFEYARMRHSVYLCREAGWPRAQWPSDKALSAFRFCNIYRELDTTTVALRRQVREQFLGPEVFLGTVLFRWFNRVQTCSAIFYPQQRDGKSAFEVYLETGDISVVKQAVQQMLGGRGPYVTGSYIINTPQGMDKLDGVLALTDKFNKEKWEFESLGRPANWREIADLCISARDTRPLRMRELWEWLRKFNFLGDFMAYEIVCDLRYTRLLDKAPDIMTWANPGPGAARGLNRIHGRMLDRRIDRQKYIEEMQDLLRMSQDSKYWPQWDIKPEFELTIPEPLQYKDWPSWEMREVEHTLCEYDKYMRVKNLEGQPRQRFVYNGP